MVESIIRRIEDAKIGVPAETRAATSTGETVFLRPRPGASRMYPETDVPPIIVEEKEFEKIRNKIPKSWEETVSELQKIYQLNYQLTMQIFDSDYLDLFESICKDKRISPNFVASILCGTITNLERKGLDGKLLKNNEIERAFNLLTDGKIAKESLEMIFESIMSGKSQTVLEAIEKTAIGTVDSSELEKILDELVRANLKIIEEQGPRSIGPLMGIAMKTMRGKVDGQKINQLLEEKIKQKLGSTDK